MRSAASGPMRDCGARTPGRATTWVASLSPWPADGFGHRADARAARPARQPAARLRRRARRRHEGQVDGGAADRTHDRRRRATPRRTSRAGTSGSTPTRPASSARSQRVRAAAEQLGATQFEVLTAAAFADFADARRRGRRGRGRARRAARRDQRARRARRAAHERRARAHRRARARRARRSPREKLAVAGPDATVVLPDDEFAHLVAARRRSAAPARPPPRSSAARSSWPTPRSRAGSSCGTGRSATAPTPRTPSTGCSNGSRSPAATSSSPRSSADKDAPGILRRLARAGRVLVATQSTNERALPAAQVAELGRAWFEVVETVDDPHRALRRARTLGPRVLITGSLYLLADLSRDE